MALTDRFRGKRGLLGWLVLRWDIFCVKRTIRFASTIHKEEQRGYTPQATNRTSNAPRGGSGAVRPTKSGWSR